MKKKDLLLALASLNDEDEILICCDGGDYWSNYLDFLGVEIKKVDTNSSLSIGHPGGTAEGCLSEGSIYAVIDRK